MIKIVLSVLYSNSYNHSSIDFNHFSSIYLFLKYNGTEVTNAGGKK